MFVTRKRVILIVMATIFAVVCLAILGIDAFIRTTKSNLDKLTSMKISTVDLSTVADGAYTGKYKVFPVEVEVKVLVKDHRIEGIELVKHRNGKGALAEVIPDRVVAAQSLQVDVIAGATYSSKVILKAIENALNQAKS